MSLIPYYLQYLSEICEGSRPAPAGIELHETDDLQKAIELQKRISEMGIPAFVKACADAAGEEIAQEEYDSFDPAELSAAISQMAAQAQTATADEPVPEEPAEPVKTEIRDIYEVFLDSICLDDALVQYLIDILRRGAKEEFEKLSHAAARTIIDMDDFLAWFGNKELIGSADEQACVYVMDKALSRLIMEKEGELAAALLSGDEKTFLLFRTQAPELRQMPAATYEWYCENYLDSYYPLRFILKQNGVKFPEAPKRNEET